MDVLLFSFALAAVRSEFAIHSAAAGAIAAIPMVTSAAGGILFGYIADRYGRARALAWSILGFSVLTALTATSVTIPQLIFWRSLAGVALGGEWAAGSVLVAETWPEKHRSKGIGIMQSGWALGYMAASLLAAIVLPRWGWRPLFLLGVLPAFFTWWIRRNVPESPAFRKKQAPLRQLLRPPLLGRLSMLTLLCCCLLFGYWGLFTWLPTYLASPLSGGGAGLGIVKSSAWLLPMQAGAFCGYILFGFLADRMGRRAVFLTFVLATAALIPVYGLCSRNATILLALGPLIGFFGHGYFSALGVIAAESFPAWSRTTAQGFSYNAGRALSALAPATVGAAADRYGLGAALACTSAFFVCGALVMSVMSRRGTW